MGVFDQEGMPCSRVTCLRPHPAGGDAPTAIRVLGAEGAEGCAGFRKRLRSLLSIVLVVPDPTGGPSAFLCTLRVGSRPVKPPRAAPHSLIWMRPGTQFG